MSDLTQAVSNLFVGTERKQTDNKGDFINKKQPGDWLHEMRLKSCMQNANIIILFTSCFFMAQEKVSLSAQWKKVGDD